MSPVFTPAPGIRAFGSPLPVTLHKTPNTGMVGRSPFADVSNSPAPTTLMTPGKKSVLSPTSAQLLAKCAPSRRIGISHLIATQRALVHTTCPSARAVRRPAARTGCISHDFGDSGPRRTTPPSRRSTTCCCKRRAVQLSWCLAPERRPPAALVLQVAPSPCSWLCRAPPRRRRAALSRT